MTAVAGVDVGSITAKAIIVDSERRILAQRIVHQGIVNERAAWTCFEEAVDSAGLRPDDISYIVTTGYGRDLVKFGDKSVTEITCHAAGVHHLLPAARTVVDVGGQDSKVISLDEDGRVVTFRMNDKCAAGTGRFLEVMAIALRVDLTELGGIALESNNPAPVSSVCTVFAESEIVSLSAQGYPKVDIIGGLHEAIANRLTQMVRAVGVREPVVMTGGVAKNQGVVRALERTLGIKIVIPSEPQITGALGAAFFALRGVEGNPALSGVRQEAMAVRAPVEQPASVAPACGQEFCERGS